VIEQALEYLAYGVSGWSLLLGWPEKWCAKAVAKAGVDRVAAWWVSR
jgi:hypothetical protein